jgi:hypothetical protein
MSLQSDAFRRTRSRDDVGNISNQGPELIERLYPHSSATDFRDQPE